MTLELYSLDRLDDLSLRLLDLAIVFRRMSNDCRANDMDHFVIHDKKAQEWLNKLDDWSRDCDGKLQTEILKRRATARASGADTKPTRGRGK
jgi:hypothetical protein